MPARIGLTLGPVLFHWEPVAWRDFCVRIADEAPVDTVVIGEVVCSKRMPFVAEHLPRVIDRLGAGGKQVLLATLALPTLERERRAIAALATSEMGMVEANDVSVLPALAGQRHAIGPFVNICNEGMAGWLAARGAVRICLPPELPRVIAPATAIEVFAFGRIPLAISARCSTHVRTGCTRTIAASAAANTPTA